MHQTIRNLAAALAVSLTATSSLAICQLQTSGDWGPAALYTGTTNCSLLDGSEEIEIPAGVSVRVVDDLVFGAVGEQVRVASGGTLTVRGIDRSGGPGRLTVELTPAGLLCADGSSCTFEGVYREVHAASPVPRADLASAGFLEAGQVVPCAGWDDSASAWIPDCDGLLTDPQDLPGSSYEVGFVYPGGVGGGSLFLGAALDAMQATDVLCFYDPDTSTPAAPVDDGFCYEITLADGDFGGSGVLKFDVRQTNPARPRDTTYPFALREVREGALEAPVAPGGRVVAVDSGVLAGIRARERVGMWLRFAGPTDAPRAESYKIVRSWNDPADGFAPLDCPGGPGTCDVLEIYDPRGFQSSQLSADRVWLDYGHAPGETFFVMAPVRLTEADGIQEPNKQSTIGLLGEADLGAVLIDDTSGLTMADTDTDRFEDVWMRDTTSGSEGNGVAFLLLEMSDTEFRRISFTGGNASVVGEDRVHVVAFSTLPALGLEFNTLAVRHHGDDSLTHSGVAEIEINRYRSEWATPVAESCNLIGQNSANGPLSGTGVDLFCQDCNRAGPFIRTHPNIDFSIRGAGRWGSSSTFDSLNTTNLTVDELLQVGGSGSLPPRVDGFVVALENGAGTVTRSTHIDVRNGIIRDTSIFQKNLLGRMDDGVLENVLVHDVDTTHVCSVGECVILRMNSNPGVAMDVTNVTLAMSPSGSTRFDQGAVAAGVGANYTIDGLLVSGMNRSSGIGRGIGGSLLDTTVLFGNTTAGPLLWDNATDAQNPAGLPPSAVVGVDPGFVNPGDGRFDTAPGSPAALADTGIRSGVESPGLTEYRWIHAITRSPVERMADDEDWDGVPVDVSVSVCAAGNAVGCSDNCPATFNPDQADADGDGVGSACDDPCDDGEDDDGDGWIDFAGGDPGCAASFSVTESPACQDGVDNDSDGLADFDGGQSVHGPCFAGVCPPGVTDPNMDGVADPDPRCTTSFGSRERSGCGFGPELVLLAPLWSLSRRKRRLRGRAS